MLLLVLSALTVAPSALGQMEALRRNDGVFIEGLRDEGMAELFGRFVEKVEDEGGLEPIAQQQMVIAQKDFAATASLARAMAELGQDDALAQQLFEESRNAYEAMIEAQKGLIDANAQDERLPIWQTDLASMLLDTYLPTYHRNAAWVYEFGVPSDEQRQAFEDAAVLALEMSGDARYRIEQLTGRLAQDGGDLRAKLEEMNIFFELREDYGQRRVPYWFAHAAYYTALLPDSHPYYVNLGSNRRVRNQAGTAALERARLLDQAEAVTTGNLSNDAQVGPAVKLLAGRILVATGDEDRADEGVSDYLEPIATEQASNWQGFLAQMAKARGRVVVGEIDTATEILSGMGDHPFVSQQFNNGNIDPRLLAADMLHRILMGPAEQARGADRAALLAEAYEMPYLPLVSGEASGRFSPVLYQRWAEQVNPGDDPASFPPMVRMGIGQIKTQLGATPASEVIYLSQNTPLSGIAIPAERERESDRRVALVDEAKAQFAQAIAYNETLIGEEVEDTVRALGLMNLGFDKYYLAEMDNHVFGAGQQAAYIEVAKLWATIGLELPDTEQAEQAMGFAMALYQVADNNHNAGPAGVTNTDYREGYRQVAETMYEYWPNHDTANNLRVYTGFYLYELSGQLDKAAEIYRGTPSSHPSYFEARRQMVLAMQKIYDNLADEIREMELTGATEDTPEAKAALERGLAQRNEDIERMRRELLNAAENLLDDAEDEVENGSRRFSAATAAGGALVAVAAMEADSGNPDDALELLEGFEIDYNPAGRLADLVNAQPDPEQAQQQLDGLIQSAQERRILTLVDVADLSDEAEREEIGAQAQAMIKDYPDVASSVVNGVLQRIEDQIDSYRAARENSLLPVNRNAAQEKMTQLALVAVDLSELLVAWAKNNGYAGTRLLPFETSLAKALLLAERAGDAVAIMEPWLEEYPNNFDVILLTADCIMGAAADNNKTDIPTLKPALDLYYKIIIYYNSQPGEKPPRFWEAWLKSLQILDIAGGEHAEDIPEKVRMLQNRVSEELGGPEFQRHFLDLYAKHT